MHGPCMFLGSRTLARTKVRLSARLRCGGADRDTCIRIANGDLVCRAVGEVVCQGQIPLCYALRGYKAAILRYPVYDTLCKAPSQDRGQVYTKGDVFQQEQWRSKEPGASLDAGHCLVSDRFLTSLLPTMPLASSLSELRLGSILTLPEPTCHVL